MVTETFNYTGSEQTWTVPDLVEEVTITAKGASGGDASNYDYGGVGGDGGVIEGTYSVTPGETLYIYVGGKGKGASEIGSDGGWPNGGDGASGSSSNGGGGGGETSVRSSSSRSDYIIIAGGGGGGGSNNPGGSGAGDGVGGDGGDASGEDGEGAGADGTGGNAGVGDTFNATSGNDFSNGGDGGNAGSDGTYAGAGGGGGYGGGGGGDEEGNEGGGGGGGSGDVVSTVTVTESTSGGNSGDGVVTLEYTQPPAEPNNASASYISDDEIEFSFDEDTSGGTPDNYEIEMQRDGGGYVSPSGGPSSPSSPGTYSYGPNSDNSYESQVGVDSSFQFRVRAVNSAGTSSWNYSSTVYTRPIPPHNPSVSRPDANTVKVNYRVKADQATTTTVFYREDSGGGYGGWTYVGDTDEHGRGATGQTRSQQFSVSSNSWMSADARYQFKLRHENKDAPSRQDSMFNLADYGNSGNVFLDTQFDSNDWDYSEGSPTFSQGDIDDMGINGPQYGSNYIELSGGEDIQYSFDDTLDGTSHDDVLVMAWVAVGSMDNSGEDGILEWYDGNRWHSISQRYGWEYNKQGWFQVHAVVPDSYIDGDNNDLRIRNPNGGGGGYLAIDRVVVSDILHEFTTPAAPTNLNLDDSVEDEISASWTLNGSVTDTAPGDVETYFGPAGGSLNGVNRAAGTTSYTFMGLNDGERYRLEVSETVHQYRRGSKSTEWDSNRATDEATTVLPAPTNLSVSNATADSADLSWTDNHDYGSTEVQYKPTSNGSWTTFSALAIGAESETLTGLRNGEQYDARVVATTEHTSTEDN